MAVCWAVGRYFDNLRDRGLVAGWGKAACTVFWISREDGVVDLIQFLFRAHSILKVCSPQSNKQIIVFFFSTCVFIASNLEPIFSGQRQLRKPASEIKPIMNLYGCLSYLSVARFDCCEQTVPLRISTLKLNWRSVKKSTQ